MGRLGRLGHPVQRQRRLYQFRNRHGFTDAADAAFEQLWEADDLTWARHLADLPGGPRRASRASLTSFNRSWARDRLEEVDLGRARQQARAALGHRDHVGGVEVRLLVLGALPLLDDHEAVRLRRGHGQVDVAAAGVAAAQHHVPGEHRLQPLRVERVEHHRDHRELDLVRGVWRHSCVPPDQEIRSAGLAPLTGSVS